MYLYRMADRDLLNKPMPLIRPEEHAPDKKGLLAPILGKLGVQTRAKEVGTEKDAPAVKQDKSSASGGTKGLPRPTSKKEARAPGGMPVGAPEDKAYKAAYFNKDVGALGAPNLRARPMAALRGEEGATDLKKVVLPPLTGSATPSPEMLGAALSAMGPAEVEGPNLLGLLERQSQWAQAKTTTAEVLAARMAQLEEMVAARQEALGRMAQLTPDHLGRSRTLTLGITADPERPIEAEGLEHDANRVIDETSAQAGGLHTRLMKVMGIKKRP